MGTNDIFNITVRTIRMQAPLLRDDTAAIRQSYNKEEEVDRLISFEALLRKRAYKRTTITTNASFYDDSDMRLDYYLVIVYDKTTNTPLLSARHDFDKSVISTYLKGDTGIAPELSYLGTKFQLDRYPPGDVFLADRLSGNISSSVYRKYRNTIFSMYYSEILNNNKHCTLLLMVRKEKRDQQLFKYLNLGFSIIGATLHKGKEHSIILRDLKNV